MTGLQQIEEESLAIKCAPSASCKPTRVSDGEQRTTEELIQGIDFIWLEVTRSCNLRCVHCYAESAPEVPAVGRMRFEDWCGVLLEGADLGCRRMQVIGGEPTVYPRLAELVRFGRKAGYHLVEVYTNGLVLSERLLAAFVECGVELAFSIYATDPRIHDAVTGRAGSREKTIKNMERAIGAGLGVRANIIAMPINYGAVEATKEFLGSLGVKNIGVDEVRSVGRGGVANGYAKRQQLCEACWRGSIAIDPDGRVFPCVFARDHYVGCAQQGLRQILATGSLRRFRIEKMGLEDERREARLQ